MYTKLLSLCLVIVFFLLALPRFFPVFGCDQYSDALYFRHLYGFINSDKPTLCGQDAKGNQPAGVCFFSSSDCATTIMPGTAKVDDVGGNSGTECQDPIKPLDGIQGACLTPTNSAGTFCIHPEDPKDGEIGQFTPGSKLTIIKTCSKRCYMDPNDNTPYCEGDARKNAVCLHPGVGGDPWNYWVDTNGAFQKNGNYACWSLCDGSYTKAQSEACPGKNGTGGSGSVNVPTTAPIPSGIEPCKDNKCITGLSSIAIDVSSPIAIVQTLFRILLSLSGLIALILIIFSGYQMSISQGNPEKIKEARERLTAAIIGLVFIIFSTSILQVVGLDILQLPGFGK